MDVLEYGIHVNKLQLSVLNHLKTNQLSQIVGQLLLEIVLTLRKDVLLQVMIMVMLKCLI